MYLKDFIGIDENPTVLDGDVINVEKLTLIAKQLLEIKQLQSIPYQLYDVASVQKYHLTATAQNIVDDDELLVLSKKCESSLQEEGKKKEKVSKKLLKSSIRKQRKFKVGKSSQKKNKT